MARRKTSIPTRAEIEEAGLRLLGPGWQPTHHRYQFITCGHLQDLKPSAVRRKQVECLTCPPVTVEPERDVYAEAESVGLTIVGLGGTNQRYLYRLPCGHARQLNINRVLAGGPFTCTVCNGLRVLEEAIAADLLILSETTTKGHGYRLYLLPCGHEQELAIQAVRNKRFRCYICGEHSWTQPAYVYKLKITVGDFTWVKIGYAKSVEARIKDYGLPKGAIVKIVKTELCPTAAEAQELEALLHRSFAHIRLPAEQMRAYHTKSGATECFAYCPGTVPQRDPNQDD